MAVLKNDCEDAVVQQCQIGRTGQTIINEARCLSDVVEKLLSLLQCHDLCLIELDHVVKLELSRI